MKIAFVGKGGSGKTTVAALFARYVASRGAPVLAIDADINQQLPEALGAADVCVPALSQGMDLLKAYVRGSNARILSTESMIKTTPPGTGSRLLTVTEHNAVYAQLACSHAGVRLLAAGEYAPDDLGVKCYHAKTGAVELFLNHLADAADEYVLVDMTAGADAFASGLFTRFDVTFILVEPTLKSLAVYEQYARYAQGHDLTLKVVANKLRSAEDAAWIERRVGADYLAGLGCSEYVRKLEQGGARAQLELEPSNRAALARMRACVDAQAQDWSKFYRQALEFHVRNAMAWANAQLGMDLTEQIDPHFDLKAAVAARLARAAHEQAQKTSHGGLGCH
jgi:CO dehydrogenase maturation factor